MERYLCLYLRSRTSLVQGRLPVSVQFPEFGTNVIEGPLIARHRTKALRASLPRECTPFSFLALHVLIQSLQRTYPSPRSTCHPQQVPPSSRPAGHVTVILIQQPAFRITSSWYFVCQRFREHSTSTDRARLGRISPP